MLRRILRVFFALALAGSTAALAQPSSPVALADLTWPELQQRIRTGATIAIVPVGGTEQSGPHMTLGKHNRRVAVLAERIAVSLGDALVAPVVAYVPEGNVEPPTSHMRYPGTLSVPDAAFEKVLEYAARSLKRHGFRDIVFLGDHGGYQKNLRAVAARLNREWAATSVRAHAIDEYYTVTQTRYVDALKLRGYTEAEIGMHAGLADTSLALAVDPGIVRVDALRAGSVAANADGVTGDPRRASAELGKLGVDAIVAATVDAIRRAVVRR